MQWNCPHCKVRLAAPDEKLETGWSFSQCYQCMGYALIRRAGINVIRVDNAPAGEQLIRPEPPRNFQNDQKSHAAQPQAAANAVPKSVQSASDIIAQSASSYVSRSPKIIPSTRKSHQQNLEKTQVEAPLSSLKDESLPTAEVTQSQVPYSENRARRLKKQANQPSNNVIRQNKPSLNQLPKPLPEVPAARKGFLSRIFSKGSFAMASLVVSCAFLIYQQGNHLFEGQINPKNSIIKDEIQQSAKAPEKNRPQFSQKLKVRIKPQVTELRGGPNKDYPVVATVTREFVGEILDWQGDWFKIRVFHPDSQLNESNPLIGGAGWIPNHMVRVISPAPLESPLKNLKEDAPIQKQPPESVQIQAPITKENRVASRSQKAPTLENKETPKKVKHLKKPDSK